MKLQLFASGLLLGQCANAFTTPSLTARSTGLSLRSRQPAIVTTYATVESSSEQKQIQDDSTAAPFLDESIGEGIPYSELTIGVLKETFPGENRVSQTPDSIKSLLKDGFTVVVEEGGGFSFSLFLCNYF